MARKGQLVFEFIVAAVLFMGLVIFVLNMLNTNVAMFTGDYGIYDMENKVVAMSEALVKTDVDLIGLADEWPVLKETRISGLNNFCNDPDATKRKKNYIDLLSNFNLIMRPQGFNKSYDFKINITATKDNGQVLGMLECDPPRGSPANITAAHVKRYAILDTTKERLDIDVWVW